MSDLLKIIGINSKGYGIIPKLVMQDQRLTRDAKCIYAYFKSFAGGGDTAFPSVSKICADLGYKKQDTYRKHFKLLKECGYVSVYQAKNDKNQFSHNVYTMPDTVDNPVDNTVDNTENSPTPEKRVSGNKVHTEKKRIRVDKGTNNNSSFNNNNTLNNNSKNKFHNFTERKTSPQELERLVEIKQQSKKNNSRNADV